MKRANENLSHTISTIDAIYISNSYLLVVSEQSCDCDEIVLKCGKNCIKLTSEALGEDGRIVFEKMETLDVTQYPYEVDLAGVCFTFDKFRYLKNGMIDGIRFAADGVFLFIFTLENEIVLTMSKYDLFGEIDTDFFEKEVELKIKKRREII